MGERATLRRATGEDLDEILALWSHFMRAHRDNPAYQRLTRNALEVRKKLFAERLEDPDAAIFVLARDDGGLDGMIVCFLEKNLPYFLPPTYARLQAPYVRPDARRKGNLKRLLIEAVRWAREQEAIELRLFVGADNVVANTIAEELGFEAIEVVRRRKVDWSGPPEEQIEE